MAPRTALDQHRTRAAFGQPIYDKVASEPAHRPYGVVWRRCTDLSEAFAEYENRYSREFTPWLDSDDEDGLYGISGEDGGEYPSFETFLDSLRDDGAISLSEWRQLRHNWITYTAAFDDAVFLTPQVHLRYKNRYTGEVGIYRADTLAWSPANQHLKVVVEADGYKSIDLRSGLPRTACGTET